ncbi:MAG: hypothetical protein ASARMPRED_001388 [Alectoria sarmentosa]|nr:MAG: hypothetical protein ASARMPRED_001388 [Alectoria sarmentosa]
MQKARIASSEKQKVTLSCEQCRQHLECTLVHRHRLARGRAGTDKTKDADLKDRVAKLENILIDWQSHKDSRTVQKTPTPPLEDGQGANNERVDDSFWATLNHQVAGIRETLDEFPDDESDDSPQSALPSAANGSSFQDFDMILFGASSCVVNPVLLEAIPRPILTALLDAYIYRVDSILKVTHLPSLRSLLLSEEPEWADPLDCPSREALRFAMCFTAVCTLTEAESRKMFMETKDKTINRFRLATEVMLSRAKLLTTSDITVLQAFVIYLAGRRTCTGYKKIWTLIASAVRIGQSLGLDTDDGRFNTPLQREIRRRVWYSIGILDMQAAFDGGSHSVIASNGLLGPLPLNIDDTLVSSAPIRSAFVEQSGLTDMSFSSMTHEALICYRRLTHVPTDSDGQPAKTRQEWTKRSKIVIDWEQRMNERYLQHCDMTQPYQRFMKIVGQDMIVSKKLLVRRPMHRLFSAGPPPADDFNVLEVATDVVERSLLKFTDPSLTPWSWFGWVKWYVLAIMLAELCGHGNGALANRAWKVAEEAFTVFADLVIDDVLWRSVEKLMGKARSTRDGSRGSLLPIPTPINPRATSSHGNLDSSRFSKGDSRFQDNNWTWHANKQAQIRTSPFNQNPEPPSETGQSRPQMLPTDVDNSMPETWVDEPEYMSWVNWELFVQDLGNLNEQDMLDSSFGG